MAGRPHPVVGYPALVDEGLTVGIAVLDTPAAAADQPPAGLRRLVLLGTPDPTKWVVAHLGNAEKLALGSSPYAGVPDLLADARLASVGELVRRQPRAVDVRDEGGVRGAVRRGAGGEPHLMRRIVDWPPRSFRRTAP